VSVAVGVGGNGYGVHVAVGVGDRVAAAVLVGAGLGVGVEPGGGVAVGVNAGTTTQVGSPRMDAVASGLGRGVPGAVGGGVFSPEENWAAGNPAGNVARGFDVGSRHAARRSEVHATNASRRAAGPASLESRLRLQGREFARNRATFRAIPPSTVALLLQPTY
jgi:hypothetical protein